MDEDANVTDLDERRPDAGGRRGTTETERQIEELQDMLALERLRGDSLTVTARALRDRAERAEGVLQRLAEWSLPRWEPDNPQTEGEQMRLYAMNAIEQGGDMQDETREEDDTRGGDTPDTETQEVTEETHREETTTRPATPNEGNDDEG
jgi:hypothetical protein